MTNKKDKLSILGMTIYAAVIFAAFLARGMYSTAAELPEPVAPEVTVHGLSHHAEPIQAEPLVFITPEVTEPVTLLDEVTEPEINKIENCVITYYCAERYAHICGTGDGLTATGETATPGVTCAVDPSVIPYGSVVTVDYGDGELHEYIAQDTGVWVTDAHVDICVDKHGTALELGRRTATVWWSAPEGIV